MAAASPTVHVPQASCHIEVSSGAEPPPPPADVTSPTKHSVILVRRQSSRESPTASAGAADGSQIKYVMTGLQGSLPLSVGTAATSLRSPAAHTVGQTPKATRARQILKKRQELSLLERKYQLLLNPCKEEPTAAVAPLPPVVICEPESGSTPKAGRTFFFVAKPVKQEDEEPEPPPPSAIGPPEILPDDPAPPPPPPKPSTDEQAAGAADNDILKRLAKYQLSEKYEILPASCFDSAEEIIHRLRMQNISLKSELVRTAIHWEREASSGFKVHRGRRKPTALVTVDRLRELEKIEAGMHSLFTPSQVRVLSREYKKNSVQWRDEDFRRALGLLEASSLRAFNYVRKQMNVPLPSLGTLKLRCPLQPDLNQRLQTVIQSTSSAQRCDSCSRRLDGDSGGVEELQPLTTMPPDGSAPQVWTAPRELVRRRRRRTAAGGSGGKRARVQQQYEEPTVYFEETPAVAAAVQTPEDDGRARGGRVRGRRAHQAEPVPEPEPELEQLEDDEFAEEEFEEEEEYEEDEEQQVVEEQPDEFSRFRSPYTSWSEWDPRQLQ